MDLKRESNRESSELEITSLKQFALNEQVN